MQLKINPTQKFQGSVHLPASKSYSIRAFLVAACGGRSRVIGASDCDDAMVALQVAKTFGVKVAAVDNGYFLQAGALKERSFLRVNVRESGTSLRFVLPLLPFYTRAARVEGEGTLVGRPNLHLCETLRACGFDLKGAGSKESVPICYAGGSFAGGTVKIDGSVSSQFVSALMIALPMAKEDTRLVMTGKTLVSRDYIVMTRQILERAGIRVIAKGAREFLIPGGQCYKGLKNFHVPSDWGLAAFFMSAAAIVPSHVTLRGYFNDDLVQSDGAILPFLSKMGLKMTRSATSIGIKGPQSLKGGAFSLKDCPDLVPIMAVTAMFAKGVTRLKDIGHARVKESDRISDLRQELLKVGARIEEKKDALVIYPQEKYQSGAVLDPHHDHRLAMAFAVLGLRVGVSIRDVECTSKSYPGFVEAFKACL